MSYIEKEKLIKADIASIENRIRHAFNQGYELGLKQTRDTGYIAMMIIMIGLNVRSADMAQREK